MSGLSGTKCNASETKTIPTRRIVLDHPSQMPSDYSSTPGGTMFSTTPGGTRIIYDRAFLMHCRNSPLAKSPPSNLPKIPGVTSPGGDAKHGNPETIKENQKPESAEDPQFEMDI